MMVRCLMFGFILLLAGAAAAEQIVQETSANGKRATRPFAVKDQWEIRWDNRGAWLNISVITLDGRSGGPGAFAETPGRGSSFQPRGGTFYLDIAGKGEWIVTVVQLP